MSDLPKIYCAVDTADLDRALALAAALQRAGCGIKLGLEFFNANGPQGIKEIRDAYPDLSLFLDLKFHDIPNTVAGAVRSVADLEPDYLNVHASGGVDMMQAAYAALHQEIEHKAVRLLAVTILTSLTDEMLTDIGYAQKADKAVLQLAALTAKAGLDGVVCSAKEIEALRKQHDPDFTLMVPGIRPAGSDAGDQRRVMTPQDALAAGATHLVIGRPITKADDPYRAAMDIMAEINAA
jgi:orotidine-5'-phosphate decarboxylase